MFTVHLFAVGMIRSPKRMLGSAYLRRKLCLSEHATSAILICLRRLSMNAGRRNKVGRARPPLICICDCVCPLHTTQGRGAETGARRPGWGDESSFLHICDIRRPEGVFCLVVVGGAGQSEPT